MSRLTDDLERWAQKKPVLALSALWILVTFIASSTLSEYVSSFVTLFLFLSANWFYKYRECEKQIEMLRFFVDDVMHGVRRCDICGIEQEVAHDLLFSERPMACKICLGKGAIPPHIGLEAYQLREKLLKQIGFSLRLNCGGKPTIIPDSFTYECMRKYESAAERGDRTVQFALGFLYSKGLRGFPLDYVKAYMWFSLAGAARYLDSIERRDHLAQRMTPQQVAEGRRLAQEWMPGVLKDFAVP